MMLVEDDLIDFAWSWRRRRPDLEIADMLDTVTEINRNCVVIMKDHEEEYVMLFCRRVGLLLGYPDDC
jgi:hypothetical protein